MLHRFVVKCHGLHLFFLMIISCSPGFSFYLNSSPALSLFFHPTVLSYFACIVRACVRACLNACVYVYTPESPSRGAIIHIILIPESGGINNIKCACACVRACLYALPNCFYCRAYIAIMHAHCALS